MKVIDLLNKIANGEKVPKKIKYEDEIYFYDGWDYTCSNNEYELRNNLSYYYKYNLNENIEIIEEPKKIEYIPILKEDEIIEINLAINQTRRKLNEIIDYINKD